MSLELLTKKLDTLSARVESLHTERDQFYKSLQQPSRAAGYANPEALIADATKGQTGIVGPDGRFLSADFLMQYARRKGLKATGIGMGPTLKAIANANGLTEQSATQASPEMRVKAASFLAQKHKEAHAKGAYPEWHPAVQKTALAEASGVIGGYTVPPDYIATLLALSEEESIFAPRAYHRPMTTLTAQVPYLDQTTAYGAGVTPFLGGIQAYYAAEAATRVESEPKFRMLDLKANELTFYAVASNTLLADNAVGLDALLTLLFKLAIAWYADYNYFQGNGVGKPLGILNAPATLSVTRTNASHFVWQDVATMISHFHREGWRAGSSFFAIHPSVLGDLLVMNDRSGTSTGSGLGRFIFQPIDQGAMVGSPDVGNGGYSCGTLWGIPVLVTEKLPALGTNGCVVLVDASKYIIGDRQDTTIDISPHVNFLTNQMTWRIIMRHDGQPWLGNVVTLQDSVWTVSPYMYLTQ